MLQGAPYVNARTILRQRADRNVFEIAWKVSLPDHTGGSRVKSSLEGSNGSGHLPALDRYGQAISGLRAGANSFSKSRDKTSLKLGIKVGTGDYQWITFSNISLVPGKDPGFQMKTEP